jgi:hypothetical protein
MGTKTLIEDFYLEYEKCLLFLKENQIMTLKSKLEFFIESRHALGRTALIL